MKIKDRVRHPDFIEAVRVRLQLTGCPYVIENVPQAPLQDAITLCGSMFGLPLRRHRLFEANFVIPPLSCQHSDFQPRYPCAWNRRTPLRVLSISGGYQRGVGLETYKDGFGVDWEVTKRELSEAIPPAYTEYVGACMMAVLE